MNQAASILADKRSSMELYKMKDSYREKTVGIRKLHKTKNWIGDCKIIFL